MCTQENFQKKEWESRAQEVVFISRRTQWKHSKCMIKMLCDLSGHCKNVVKVHLIWCECDRTHDKKLVETCSTQWEPGSDKEKCRRNLKIAFFLYTPHSRCHFQDTVRSSSECEYVQSPTSHKGWQTMYVTGSGMTLGKYYLGGPVHPAARGGCLKQLGNAEQWKEMEVAIKWWYISETLTILHVVKKYNVPVWNKLHCERPCISRHATYVFHL